MNTYFIHTVLKRKIHFLGLSIDHHLNWNEHAHRILMKINTGLNALSKISFYCDIQTLKNMYFYHVSYGRSTTVSTVARQLQQWWVITLWMMESGTQSASHVTLWKESSSSTTSLWKRVRPRAAPRLSMSYRRSTSVA